MRLKKRWVSFLCLALALLMIFGHVQVAAAEEIDSSYEGGLELDQLDPEEAEKYAEEQSDPGEAANDGEVDPAEAETGDSDTSQKEESDVEDVDGEEDPDAEKSEAPEEEEEEPAYKESELRLLSCLIFCEAQGSSYKTMVAVGCVVMNRVKNKNYPNSVKKVIYQKKQFGPASSGQLAKKLKEYDKGKFDSKVEKKCIKAAKAVLTGEETMKGYYFFRGYSASLKKSHPKGKKIGSEYFY